MEFVFVFILVLFFALLLMLLVRFIKWLIKKKELINIALFILSMGVLSFLIHHFFIKEMHFIQSEVYANLYVIKYPEKDQTQLQEAIQQKIKEHLTIKHFTGKKLAYTNNNGIFFYTYTSALPWNIFQDAGTVYFIENEEDLGGFVSEELGMYTEYRIAEFYYNPCEKDTSKYCGVIDYFNEGAFLKTVHLQHLDYKK